jgi:hypothetical protein
LEDDTLPPRPRHYRSSAPASSSRPSSGCHVEWFAHDASGARACARSSAAPERSSRGFTGQGPGGFRLPGAFRRDCSQRKLRPDPIGSDTCCREARRECRLERPTPQGAHVLACAHDELTGRTCLREAHQTPALLSWGRKRPKPQVTNAPPVQSGAHEAPSGLSDELASPPEKEAAFATCHRRQGRFPRRSAKRDAFCCTRGAFHRCASPFESGLSPELDPGLGSSPQIVPNLWTIGCRRLCVPRVIPPPLTRQWGARTRLPRL